MRFLGRHVEAARGLLRISQAQLATVAGVSEMTIKRFEAGTHDLKPATKNAIRDALEKYGIEFTNGDSPGVKLRPERASISTE